MDVWVAKRMHRTVVGSLGFFLLLMGCADSSKPTAPVIRPASGTYTYVPELVIEDATTGAAIYYTTDGSTPTTSSLPYSASSPVSVPQGGTIKAIAFARGTSSDVATASYTVNLPAVPAPVFKPAAGTYTGYQTVTLTASTGSTIYYTTDGSTPTTSSPVYTAAIKVKSNETLSAFAVDTSYGYSQGTVGTAAYTIILPPTPTPVFSPAPSTYAATQSVTITSNIPTATIYYTTDGSTPTTSSPIFTGPVSVASSETLSALATDPADGYLPSAIATGSYAILTPPAFSVAAGIYSAEQHIALSDAVPGVSIYYTTDGSVATTSSTPYTGPVDITSTESINAIATLMLPGQPLLVTQNVSASYIIHQPGNSTVSSGTALAGTPIAGASVQLYQAGTAGYTSAAVPLLGAPLVTDATGSFNLSGQYTCTPGTYLYLTASGGSTTAGVSNPNLTLVAAIGACDSLTPSSAFTINEETTVAAAYALAPFSQGSTFGQTQMSHMGDLSTAPADNISTSNTNLPGLANAMATSGILTNVSTGSSPGNNTNNSAVPEWWQVNLIANMLSACVRSAGGSANDGSACGTLFGQVAPGGGAAPADTFQAALALARTPVLPSANITALYGMIPSGKGTFQPYPVAATAITDFSVGIQYQPSAAGVPILSQPSGLSIDSLGNVWIGNVPHTGISQTALPGAASLVELTPTGVPVQAGTNPATFLINGYSLNGNPSAFAGQMWLNGANYQLNGALVPSIDQNNNVWFNDRQNSVIAKVAGSGTAYAISGSYTNGGNALAMGYPLAADSVPVATYIDGNNSVWFQNGGGNGTLTFGNCAVPLSLTVPPSATTPNRGIGVILNGDPTTTYVGSSGNVIANGSNGYLVIDPGLSDTVGGTAIPGQPFVWTLGTNGSANLIVQSYTQKASATPATGNPSCNTPLSAIGISPNTAPGSTDTTADPGHSSTKIPDIANTALNGDYFHFLSTPQDWTFDKFGNLWIANFNSNPKTTINTAGAASTTVTAPDVMSAISKVTPSYGSTFNATSAASNFKFAVYHGVAGLLDGQTGSYPLFLTTDGAGNVWFALNNSPFLNAITNSGTGISPNSTATSNAGFAGSTCVCTFNGTAKTYGRPTGTVNRPAVDQSGNIWVPYSAVGSAYVDVLVGIAAPRANPDSVSLKNKTFASEP